MGRGRARGADGAWTWGALRSGVSARGGRSGRGRGARGSSYGHDDRLQGVAKSDRFLKTKREGFSGARGKGKGKGKMRHRDNETNGISVGPVVRQVESEQIQRHCEVRKAHAMAVTCMAMTAQGVYTGSRDKSLKRWKPVKNDNGAFALQAELTVPLPEACTSLLFNGGWLFCGLYDGTIQAFAQDGAEKTLQGHRRSVQTMLVHHNVLITGAVDREVKLWQMDAATSSFNCTHTLKESIPGPVSKLHVLGNNLFVGGMDGLAVVNLETLTVSNILPPQKPVADMLEFQGHIIVAYSEGSLRIFDADGKLKNETKPLVAGPLLSLAGLESGPRVLCGHAKGHVSTITLPTFEYRTNFQALDACKVESILCAGHDGIFLLGAQDGTLQLWQRVGP